MAIVQYQKIHLVTMEEVGLDIFSAEESAAIKLHKLETDAQLQNLYSLYANATQIQKNSLTDIAIMLIKDGVDDISKFNNVSPFLRALYLKGYEQVSDYDPWIVIWSGDPALGDRRIKNDNELLKEYKSLFNKKSKKNQKLTKKQLLIKELGSKLIAKATNFVANIKRAWSPLVDYCKSIVIISINVFIHFYLR